ncbi:hypothetical protein [Flavihumibacter cheonanensis]|nr:hypothetical protein [Flavihumibacter cheonanensis]
MEDGTMEERRKGKKGKGRMEKRKKGRGRWVEKLFFVAIAGFKLPA